jgi:hypothetical protein
MSAQLYRAISGSTTIPGTLYVENFDLLELPENIVSQISFWACSCELWCLSVFATQIDSSVSATVNQDSKLGTKTNPMDNEANGLARANDKGTRAGQDLKIFSWKESLIAIVCV